MNPTQILWPVAALAILTFAVLLVVPFRRFKAAFAGQVRASDFRYGESANVPGEVSIPNRNYMNLLESTYNRVTHRLAAFAASIVVLVSLWVHLLFALPAA